MPIRLPMASVLLVMADAAHRRSLARACAATGLPVTAVGCLAAVERWPVGDIVITDPAHLTPWWQTVGAKHVLVRVDAPAEVPSVRARGTTGWLLRQQSASEIAAVARTLATS